MVWAEGAQPTVAMTGPGGGVLMEEHSPTGYLTN